MDDFADAVEVRFRAKHNAIPRDFDLLASDGSTVLPPGRAMHPGMDLRALGGGYAADAPLHVRLL